MMGVVSDGGVSDGQRIKIGDLASHPEQAQDLLAHLARRFRLKTFALMTLQLMLVFGIMVQRRQKRVQNTDWVS